MNVPSSNWSEAELEKRIVRYSNLRPCTNAFVDSRTPGSDKKENFTIVGPGVSENPNQYVHIPEPHGFNIGGARQPPGCLNSQHSHETAEVFIVHNGKWRFLWGVNADDGFVDLGPGDTISIPIHMFRGFENIGDDTGFLFAVLGGDDPGKVTWAPKVFDLAQEYGLVLLKGGRLVDTTIGEKVPEGAEHEAPPDAENLRQFTSPIDSALIHCVVRFDELAANLRAPFASSTIEECGIITPKVTQDGFPPGPIVGWWPHGFNLRALKLQCGASIATHCRSEAEVIFIQEGEVNLKIEGASATLEAGDTISIPRSARRSIEVIKQTTAFVVRGTEDPTMPVMIERPAA